MMAGRAHKAAELAELGRDLAEAFAAAAQAVLQEVRLRPGALAAVGCSGQRLGGVGPGRRGPAELVLPSPAQLAGRVGAPTVGDFEAADLAAGGRGGPVTAWADGRLFGDERLARVVVHLGAVATLTFVPAAPAASDLVAFDVGPSTVVLDALAARQLGRPWDTDGAAAAHGAVHPALLNEMLAHPYFQQAPPKRTAPAAWGERYLWQLTAMARKHRCADADVLATAVECVARTVARAATERTERPHQVVLAGGGARNIHLAGRIRALLSPSSTLTCERLGVPLRLHGAACMALLAAARLDACPAGLPGVTGARRRTVLGAVALPAARA
jgi:anhydro-N-acetylmuramic acid kinase